MCLALHIIATPAQYDAVLVTQNILFFCTQMHTKNVIFEGGTSKKTHTISKSVQEQLRRGIAVLVTPKKSL